MGMTVGKSGIETAHPCKHIACEGLALLLQIGTVFRPAMGKKVVEVFQLKGEMIRRFVGRKVHFESGLT